MFAYSLTYQQSVFKRYHSDKHFSEFLPTRWRQKSTGIDTEQNYVTVALLCIVGGPFSGHPVHVFCGSGIVVGAITRRRLDVPFSRRCQTSNHVNPRAVFVYHSMRHHADLTSLPDTASATTSGERISRQSTSCWPDSSAVRS